MWLIEWLRNRRIRQLEIDLAEVEAEIESDACIAKGTGTVFPGTAALNARARARILKQLEHLGWTKGQVR